MPNYYRVRISSECDVWIKEGESVVSDDVVVVGPPLTYVSWGCSRCGFTGGVANTTFPVEQYWTEAMGRELLLSLRRKLIRVHQAKHGCVATIDDFILKPFHSQHKEVIGVIR